MNITAGEEGSAEAVLIRGVFPCDGISEMYDRYRKNGRRSGMTGRCGEISAADVYKCTNGPGKLCIAMGIGIDDNSRDMLSDSFFVRDDGYYADEILCSPRIGIDYAGEAAFYPWRFHVGLNHSLPELSQKQISIIQKDITK